MHVIKMTAGGHDIIAIDTTAPFSDPRGWMQWPGHDDYSLQFMRVLGAAQEGGSTVSECLLAASSIDPSREDSWYRQWMRTAHLNRERGEAALTSGHVKTALSNWLRAANYFCTAQAFLADDDERKDRALGHMLTCSHLYLRHSTPAGEIVGLPRSDDDALQGYFLPAPARGRRPVVVCVGAPGQYKEESLYRMPRFAHERGLSLLLIDLPGAGHMRSPGRNFDRYGVETAISGWMDYLQERADVDGRRIALFGDGQGASFATRGAAFDDRFAAVVCDAGIWELHERAFLAARMGGSGACQNLSENIEQLCRTSTARRIRCPILVAPGDRDWLDADHVAQCCSALVADGLRIDLKAFTASEAAAPHAQLDNPTIGNEVIFDWLADRLTRSTTGRTTTGRAQTGLK